IRGSDGEGRQVRPPGPPALCVGLAGRLSGGLPEHARCDRGSRGQPVRRRGWKRAPPEVHAASRRASRVAGRQATGAAVMTRRLVGVIVVLFAAAAAIRSQERSAAFSASELTALPRANWLKNGGNLFNQNYSPLTQINRETVAGLKGVWRTHLNGSGI